MKTHSIQIGNLTAQREERVTVEQTQLLFQKLLPCIIFAYIALIFFIIYFSEVDDFVYLVLVDLVFISLFIPCWLYQSYKKNKNSTKSLIQLSRYFVLSVFFSSLLWSLFFCWVYDPNDTHNAYLIIFSCALFLVGAAPVLSNYFLSYCVFASVFSLPLIFTWVISSNTDHQVLGFLMLGLLAVMLTFSYWLNQTWKNAISLRFENFDLIELLQVQKNTTDKANKAKSKFLAAVSHDFRQPLYALSLFTAILDESVKQPEARRVIDQINRSTTSLEDLLNSLLAISQLDAGVIIPKKTSVDLRNLLAKLKKDYELQAEEKGIELIFSDGSYLLFTDESLLEQILRNYLSNAIRYSEAGRVMVCCERETEASISINVTDTGIGISDYEHQVIFDEFYQLDNQQRDRNKGLGLGLAIVQRAASLLEHPIRLQSKLGKGSTFSVIVERATE